MPGTSPEADVQQPAPQSPWLRALWHTAVGTSIGGAIAWISTRPGWDDTGILAGLLALGGALCAIIGLDVMTAALCVAMPLTTFGPMSWREALLVYCFALAGAGLAAFAKRAIRTR
jgi:hypothetical protein